MTRVFTFKVVFAFEIGRVGHVQRADAGNEELTDERLARSRSHRPSRSIFVPTTLVDADAEPDARQQVVMITDSLQISQDLRLRWETRRPERVGEEGKGVQVRHDVASAAGVRVVVPCPTQAGGLFQDDVRDAGGF